MMVTMIGMDGAALPLLLDITDLLREIFPLLIFVFIGILALLRRFTESLMRRRQESEKFGEPPPPGRQPARPSLGEEIKRYMEMLDSDLRPGSRPAPETDEAPSPPMAEAPSQPAPPPSSATRPVSEPAHSPRPRFEPVARSVRKPRRRRWRVSALPEPARRESRRRSVPDLRAAVISYELLSPPLADRPPGARFWT